jgi:uncharacterized protein
MSERRIADPREVVKPGQVVKVKVLEIDVKRNRIALTLRLSDPLPQSGGREKSGSGSAKTADRRSSKPEKSDGGGALAAALAKAAERRKNP